MERDDTSCVVIGQSNTNARTLDTKAIPRTDRVRLMMKEVNHLQVIPGHMIPPRNIQVRNRCKLIELVAHAPGTPSVSNGNAHGIIDRWAWRRPGKVHPVIGVNVLLVPDAADLHICVFVNEGFLFAKVKTCVSHVGTIRTKDARVVIRDCIESDSWDIGPVVLVLLWDDKASACCNVVDGAIIVVMMMMGNLNLPQQTCRYALIDFWYSLPKDEI